MCQLNMHLDVVIFTGNIPLFDYRADSRFDCGGSVTGKSKSLLDIRAPRDFI